jgi:hypothetical protein
MLIRCKSLKDTGVVTRRNIYVGKTSGRLQSYLPDYVCRCLDLILPSVSLSLECRTWLIAVGNLILSLIRCRL